MGRSIGQDNDPSHASQQRSNSEPSERRVVPVLGIADDSVDDWRPGAGRQDTRDECRASMSDDHATCSGVCAQHSKRRDRARTSAAEHWNGQSFGSRTAGERDDPPLPPTRCEGVSERTGKDFGTPTGVTRDDMEISARIDLEVSTVPTPCVSCI